LRFCKHSNCHVDDVEFITRKASGDEPPQDLLRQDDIVLTAASKSVKQIGVHVFETFSTDLIIWDCFGRKLKTFSKVFETYIPRTIEAASNTQRVNNFARVDIVNEGEDATIEDCVVSNDNLTFSIYLINGVGNSYRPNIGARLSVDTISDRKNNFLKSRVPYILLSRLFFK